MKNIFIFLLGVVMGISIIKFSSKVEMKYVEKCNLYGWEFYGFIPEPTCNIFENKFPLSRLEAMYPNATPFPELPLPNKENKGGNF